MPTKRRREANTLYRCYNEAGQLLYIGITNGLVVRVNQHAKSKTWWTEVAGVTLEHFDSRAAVEAAERAAIKAENPLYNVVHKEGVDRKRRNKAPASRWEAPEESEVWLRLMQAHEMLEPLDISLNTVRNWADTGVLRVRRLGPNGKSGHRRIAKSSVEAVLARSLRGPVE